MANNRRDLALFNMAIDSKLRGCDLVCLKVRDVFAAGRVKERTSGTQSKTGKPVRFEITETKRQSIERWIAEPEMLGLEYLWPSRSQHSVHLSTRQYARILRDWVASIGLEPSAYTRHGPSPQGVFRQMYAKRLCIDKSNWIGPAFEDDGASANVLLRDKRCSLTFEESLFTACQYVRVTSTAGHAVTRKSCRSGRAVSNAAE